MTPPGGYAAVLYLLKTGAGDTLLRDVAWDAIDAAEYDPSLISFFWAGTALAALADWETKAKATRPSLQAIVSETAEHYAAVIRDQGFFYYKCIKQWDGQWVTVYKGGQANGRS